jgi:hypothetical protein
MNISDHELEQMLSAAPEPGAPRALKARLVAGVRLPPVNSARAQSSSEAPSGSWFRQWWPAMASAALSLACGVVLATQRAQIRAIQDTLRQSTESVTSGASGQVQAEAVRFDSESQKREQQEIDRLKHEAATLGAKVSQLEQLKNENQKLRDQLAAPATVPLTGEEEQAIEEARAKAMTVQCVNNLKQLGLSVRVWEIDESSFPRDILLMTNEMSTPKILVCPADTGRQAAPDWRSYSAANLSYEYLAPDGSNEDIYRILFRCPIHGNIALSDGSVQAEVAKKRPETIVMRDGKLYYDPSRRAPDSPSGATATTPQ